MLLLGVFPRFSLRLLPDASLPLDASPCQAADFAVTDFSVFRAPGRRASRRSDVPRHCRRNALHCSRKDRGRAGVLGAEPSPASHAPAPPDFWLRPPPPSFWRPAPAAHTQAHVIARRPLGSSRRRRLIGGSDGEIRGGIVVVRRRRGSSPERAEQRGPW